MSIPERPRPPAWVGLEPGEVRDFLIDDAWAQQILTAIGHDGQLLARRPQAGIGENYYSFVPLDDSRRLFLKTVSDERLPSQLAANRIAEWLADHALPVSPLVHDYPRRLDAGHQLLAYRQIDGRFARAERNDLHAVGRLLGRTHNVLKALPWAQEIRTRSAQRDQLFEQWHAQQLAAPGTPPAVRELLQQTAPGLPQRQAQTVHGDLNLGNLLFGLASGQPLLLDFEDANHNWHSPLVDLAMALERLVLVRCDNPQQAGDLGSALLQGYLATVEEAPQVDSEPTAILQALAVRALLLLGNAPAGTDCDGERDKFLYLYRLADQYRVLLQQLWQQFDHGR